MSENVVVWTMLPEVAVTVTVEVPGVTGVGEPEPFEEPPHPAMVRSTISRESEPPKIAIDLSALRRLRKIGMRPAIPSGKIALAIAVGFGREPACGFVA